MPANDEHDSIAGSDRAASGLGHVVSNVGDRIQEILDTAERVAGDIRAEAEAAGANYLYERRREADRVVDERIGEIAALTQSLSVRAASVEREAAALISQLEEARRRLALIAGREPLAPAPDPAPPPPAPDPLAQLDPTPNDRIPEQAVLRATQMAVAGSERTEIERMLRVEFGIQDPMSVVDEMLRSERA